MDTCDTGGVRARLDVEQAHATTVDETSVMLRAAVTLLAIIAAAKIGAQEYLYRITTHDLIMTTFRPRAVAACKRSEQTRLMVASAAAWDRASETRLVIGKSDLDIGIWQTDHALWRARYRNPYLFLVTPVPPGHVLCEYDIANDVATLSRM